MEYQYIATTEDGKLKRGSYDSSSKDKVREYLMQQNLKVVSIHGKQSADKKKAGLLGASIGGRKAALIDKIIVAKHLAIMLRAGMALNEALENVSDQATSKKMKAVINQITIDVNNGKTLASSLAMYPKIFSGIFIGMVKVGEASGTLERNLEYIAGELEKDYELTRKVKAAMLYPVIVLSATVIMGTGLTIFILPKIVDMFSTFKLDLPLTTEIFLSVANFLVDYGIYVLIVIVVGLILLRIMSKAKKFKPFFHKVYLKIPIFKKIIKDLNLARMNRSLSILLKSGVTINESLEIATMAVGNVQYENILRDSMAKVKKGTPLATALSHEEYVPSMVNQMIAIGEKTGKLEESLFYLADFYEEEVDNTTKNISTVIEPILLIVIGVVLGFLAVAIISPIYQFTGQLQR
ncbi:MAG: type II secretion system F family protein [Candidatus Daviesbacteria bacterium]|nr:type II secretion system F family protein [Candidatus Daviesbacteria bacterium]